MDFQTHVSRCQSDSSSYIKVREILNKVVTGETSRDYCKQGLCDLICDYELNLFMDDVMEGYKYWSEFNGYIILVGPKNWDVSVNRSKAIAQFSQEAIYGNDEYWEARLELARHWIRFLDKVIEAAK
ncbi:hypothetical protein AHP1_1161 [Aeromonas phage Ahp1_CNU-2021]|nr:hypothetical protein AHP1_1161 [Aeromonas phage Ahp1_CNU-2021]